MQLTLAVGHLHVEQPHDEGHRGHHVGVEVGVHGIGAAPAAEIDARHRGQGAQVAAHALAVGALGGELHGGGVLLGDAEGHHETHDGRDAAPLEDQLALGPELLRQLQQIDLRFGLRRGGGQTLVVLFHSAWHCVIWRGWRSRQPSFRARRPWSLRPGSARGTVRCGPASWAR